MADSLSAHYIENALEEFRSMKALTDKAAAQVSDEEFFRTIDPESNSIALIMKHMAGNMRSRWTDFLTTDGEKPDRGRDSEFVLDPGTTRETVARWWEEGWRTVFAAIDPLTPDDVSRTVRIRGEPHTVLQAITRQIAHYAYHVGQIVLLAKHARGAAWQSLSIPKGASQRYQRRG